MILQRIAFVMLLKSMTMEEVFDLYDHDEDGYWDQTEQWRALKELFPSITVEEQGEMYKAMQALDVNQDDRVSKEELMQAMMEGAPVQLQAWGEAGAGRKKKGSLLEQQSEQKVKSSFYPRYFFACNVCFALTMIPFSLSSHHSGKGGKAGS